METATIKLANVPTSNADYHIQSANTMLRCIHTCRQQHKKLYEMSHGTDTSLGRYKVHPQMQTTT